MKALSPHPSTSTSTSASPSKIPWLLSVGLAAVLGLIGLLICFTGQRTLESITTTGYSAPVLFNQANADQRGGKTAQAIVRYERAKFLAPGDGKIQANLNWARTHAGLPAIPQNGMQRAVSWASPNTMAWLGSLGLILLGASWVCARPHVQERTFGIATGAFGLALMALSITSVIFAWQTSREAVVVSMDTPARISPTTVSEVSFKLPAGGIATMWGHHGNFVLVADASGHTGWVSQGDLQPILPARTLSPL
jgi:hypothetical protein